MSAENKKPTSRKRGPMNFLTKDELRYLLGTESEQCIRQQQLRKIAEERAAKIPRLEQVIETANSRMQQLEKEQKEKEEAHKKSVKTLMAAKNAEIAIIQADNNAKDRNIETLKAVCQNLTRQLQQKSCTKAVSTQTVAVARVENGIQTEFSRTTISTQTQSHVCGTNARSGLQQPLANNNSENRSDTPSMENLDPLIPNSIEQIDAAKLSAALQNLPAELQTKMYTAAIKFAAKKLRGEEIPQVNWAMKALIDSWVVFWQNQRR